MDEKSCLECGKIIQNCINCTNEITCDVCARDYHVSEGLCVIDCDVVSCISCIDSPKICSLCQGNKKPVNDGGVCAVIINNCANYSRDGFCLKCAAEFYLKDNICNKCAMKNCLECTEAGCI